MNATSQTFTKLAGSKPLTIGRLARQACVNVETVRYYQRIGLIEEPVKPFSGFRVYPTQTVDRIKFIKRAQALGFSLSEISELLDMGDGRCEDVRHRVEIKRTQIQAQIRALQALDKTLEELVIACRAERTPTCPIVETLANDERR